MIRIAIVEDEKEYVQILKGYLKQYEEMNHVTFWISVFSDGLDIVAGYRPGRHEGCGRNTQTR